MNAALGLVALHAGALAGGFGFLAPLLRARPAREWPSYAGLALLVGIGLSCLLLEIAVVLGARLTLGAYMAVCAALVIVGVLAFPRARLQRADRRPARPAPSLIGSAVAVVAGAALCAIVVLTVVAGFRAGPFLDDTWTQWLSRGLALEHLGLDSRLFAGETGYPPFPHLAYPLWWSILIGLDTQAVGHIDMRLVGGETAILLAAFVAGVARLLWTYVRPALLWPALLLVVAAPELLRQTQIGGADVPLAIYLAAFVAAAAVWLLHGDVLALGAAFALGAAGVAIKSEGAPQLILLALGLSPLALAGLRRRAWILGALVLLCLATSIPWRLWLAGRDVASEISYGEAARVALSIDRTDRLDPTVDALAAPMLAPRQWLLVIPLCLAASLLAALLTRRLLWLAPAACLALLMLFWIGVYWTGPYRLGPPDLWLYTSAYRVVDTVSVSAAVLLAVLGERILTHGYDGRRRQRPVRNGPSATRDVAPGR